MKTERISVPVRCWGTKQRTASPCCPSPAQTWGAAPHPCPKGPCSLAGRDGSTQGCCCGSTGAVTSSEGEEKAPGRAGSGPQGRAALPGKEHLCRGSARCAAHPCPGAHDERGFGTAAQAAAATCPAPSPGTAALPLKQHS